MDSTGEGRRSFFSVNGSTMALLRFPSFLFNCVSLNISPVSSEIYKKYDTLYGMYSDYPTYSDKARAFK